MNAKDSAITALLCAAIFGLACLPLLTTPVLPTVDFYDHISRYFVLSHVAQDGFLGQAYQANWSILPNIGLDIVGTALLRHEDVLSGAKMIAILIFLTQFTGVLFFSRTMVGRLDWRIAILTVPLLYSFIFTWGFANFLLGLGLVFWGGGVWLWLRQRLGLATIVGALFALAIFLTHGLAFALYGLLAGGLEVGALTSGATNPVQFAKRLFALAAQAVLPVALFAVSATAGASDGVSNVGLSIRRLASQGELPHRLGELAIYRLQTVLRVAEGPALWFDVATFVVTGAVLIWLTREQRLSIPKAAWPAIALGGLLVLLVPPAMFGVGYVGDRMPLFLALLTVGSLAFKPGRDRIDVVAGSILTILVAGRIALIAVDWSVYPQDFTAYEAVVSRIPSRSVVSYVNVLPEHRIVSRRRCEMYGPLLVSLHSNAAPLFAIPTAQPMVLTGRLAYALSALPVHERSVGAEAIENYAGVVETLVDQRRFDYALLCDADRLGPARLAALPVVAQKGRFTLLKVR